MEVKDIITISISLFSLVISLFVFFRSLFTESFKLKCEKVKWFASMKEKQPFFIWMIISNNSKMPVSVLKMELECIRDNKKLTAISRGEKHLVMTRKKTEGEEFIHSNEYPICINGYSAFGGYIHFSSNEHQFNFENQDVIITVYTNRGKKKQKMHLDYGSNVFRVMLDVSGEGKIKKNGDGTPIDFQYDGI